MFDIIRNSHQLIGTFASSQIGHNVFLSVRAVPLFRETFLFPAQSREQKLQEHTTFCFPGMD